MPEMEQRFSTSASIVRSAARVVPTGVTSAVRRSTVPTPLVFERGWGSQLTDVDGNDYDDYVLGYGPLMLGHSPQRVLDAVRETLGRYLLLGAQHRLEETLGQLVADAVPSAEWTCFSSTGSEAVAVAIRIARAATGRTLILKFEGHYHGWFDAVALNPPGVPASRGEGPVSRIASTAGVRLDDSTAVIRWNEPGELRSFLDEHGQDLAAVILEPVPQAGLIEADTGYLDELVASVHDAGALVIFDEVVTGFRVARGGAQQLLGVVPDLTVLAKALGAGFPVSAVTGGAEVMAPVIDGRLAHMGTFNGHPPSLAAACAALDEYRRPGLYDEVESLATRLAAGIDQCAQRNGSTLRSKQVGPMLWTWFGGHDMRKYSDLEDSDHVAARAFSAELLRRGVHIQPRGTWMLSTAHSVEDIDRTLTAVSGTVRTLAEQGIGVGAVRA